MAFVVTVTVLQLTCMAYIYLYITDIEYWHGLLTLYNTHLRYFQTKIGCVDSSVPSDFSARSGPWTVYWSWLLPAGHSA